MVPKIVIRYVYYTSAPAGAGCKSRLESRITIMVEQRVIYEALTASRFLRIIDRILADCSLFSGESCMAWMTS